MRLNPQERPVSLPMGAQLLGISEPTMRRYVKAGKIPYFKVGNAYKFYLSDLEKFMEKSPA
jgi:excisionase family DNA binding protein